MKEIDIKEQPSLTLGRTVQITINGIRYRLFRSSVTVVVVAVAIAFLMNVLSESLVKKSLAQKTETRITELRKAAFWASRLSNPGNAEEILLGLATATEGSPIYREAQNFAGASAEEIAKYHREAKEAEKYNRFFAHLKYGRKRALVHRATGVDIFDRLLTTEGWDRFETALADMKSVRFVTPLDEFKEFLSRWPSIKEMTLKIKAGRERAIHEIEASLDGKSMLEALAQADGSFGETIRRVGFVLQGDDAATVSREAKRMLEMNELRRTVTNPDVRSKVAGYLDITTGAVDAQSLWKLLRKRDSAEWYFRKLKELDVSASGVTVERAIALAKMEAEERSLGRAELMITSTGGGLLGIGERMTWLVLASMLVCVVGISNAMLMSVTERFREIATLKCLGALDGFIMLMFVLEACCLGVAGAFVGSLIGMVLGLLRMLMSFGGLMFTSVPFGDIGIAIGLSVVLGVILAAVASVYPSFKAAQLAPMEAMRIE